MNQPQNLSRIYQTQQGKENFLNNNPKHEIGSKAKKKKTERVRDKMNLTAGEGSTQSNNNNKRKRENRKRNRNAATEIERKSRRPGQRSESVRERG